MRGILFMSILKQIPFLRIQVLLYSLLYFLAHVYSSYAQQVTFNQVFPAEVYFRFITGVTQDTLGYMWFSSYGIGLSRYDGYHVTLFRNDPRDSNSLATNNIVCIFADHNGMIWVGTQSG